MTVRYVIEPQPQAATFLVELNLSATDDLLLRLPAWLPGSYMIRDMAAEIQSLAAFSHGQEIACRKIDKSTWRVSLGGKKKKIQIRYEVFAQDTSVRRAYLDTDRGFLTFSSLCLVPIGMERESVEVTIKAPKSVKNWKVATTLDPVGKTAKDAFGTYRAENFDRLMDSPVEMGSWEAINFKVLGVPHRIVLSGKAPPFDRDRLREDVKKCVQTVIEFFDPVKKKAPFKSYTFFLNLTESLYGGLEHAESTALVASFYDLPIENAETSVGYAKLLELFTHEYFHAWWVKRVKPAVFIPYDLSQESYTELLWVFEGFTSYYDALLTARSGAISSEDYLRSVAETLNRHVSATAKKRQSLAQSSFDAWIKYYKVRTNRSRSVTSYYDKGALVALALDAEIRKRSQSKHSLDDVLRFAWKQYLQAGEDYVGLNEGVISELIYEATGVDLTHYLDCLVYGTQEPDYSSVFKPLGVVMQKEPLPIEREVLGVSLRGEDFLTISQLDEGAAAEEAGLCVGDELLAIDSIKLKKANLKKLLDRYRDQKQFVVHVFRRGLLKAHTIKLGKKHDQSAFKLSAENKITFKKWLGF